MTEEQALNELIIFSLRVRDALLRVGWKAAPETRVGLSLFLSMNFSKKDLGHLAEFEGILGEQKVEEQLRWAMVETGWYSEDSVGQICKPPLCEDPANCNDKSHPGCWK